MLNNSILYISISLFGTSTSTPPIASTNSLNAGFVFILGIGLANFSLILLALGEEYFLDSGYYKFHEAYHLLKFSNEKQILEKAYNEYLELKRNNLWGSRKYY